MWVRGADPRPVGALNDWLPIGTSGPDSPHSTEAVQKHDCPSTRRICPPRLRPNAADSNASPLMLRYGICYRRHPTQPIAVGPCKAALELGTAFLPRPAWELSTREGAIA